MQQAVMMPTGGVPTETSAQVNRAGRWLWFALLFMLATVSIGISWDRAWHLRNRFETFYSPPHLFIYTSTIVTILLVAGLTFSARLRPWFGTAFRMRLFAFPVPGALVITAGGLAMLGFAGLVLDNYWHTTFGLDETPWSTPHNMLGWSWFVATLGFISCRLALRPVRPLRWFTAIALGWLILSFSATPFLGPFHKNLTPQTVAAETRAIATLPALRENAGIAHTFRIYAAANLTRTNPAFVLFGAVWAGAALAMLRGLDRRAWVLLAAVGIYSLVALLSDRGTARTLGVWGPLVEHPANWLPPPILPAALAFALAVRLRLAERWAWLLAGGVFGALTWFVWGRESGATVLLLVPLAAPALWAGAWIGGRVARVLAEPTANAVRVMVPLLGLTAPLALGCVDLYLRHTVG